MDYFIKLNMIDNSGQMGPYEARIPLNQNDITSPTLMNQKIQEHLRAITHQDFPLATSAHVNYDLYRGDNRVVTYSSSLRREGSSLSITQMNKQRVHNRYLEGKFGRGLEQAFAKPVTFTGLTPENVFEYRKEEPSVVRQLFPVLPDEKKLPNQQFNSLTNEYSQTRRLNQLAHIIDDFEGFETWRQIDLNKAANSGFMNYEGKFISGDFRNNFILDHAQVENQIRLGADPESFVLTGDGQARHTALKQRVHRSFDPINKLLSLKHKKIVNNQIELNKGIGHILGLTEGTYSTQKVNTAIHNYMQTMENPYISKGAPPSHVLKQGLPGTLSHLESIKIQGTSVFHGLNNSATFLQAQKEVSRGLNVPARTQTRLKTLHANEQTELRTLSRIRSNTAAQYTSLMNEIRPTDSTQLDTRYNQILRQIQSGKYFDEDTRLRVIGDIIDQHEQNESAIIDDMSKQFGITPEKASNELKQYRSKRDKASLQLAAANMMVSEDAVMNSKLAGATLHGTEVGKHTNVTKRDTNFLGRYNSAVNEQAIRWQQLMANGDKYQFPDDLAASSIQSVNRDTGSVRYVRDHLDLSKDPLTMQFEYDLRTIESQFAKFRDKPIAGVARPVYERMQIAANQSVQIPLTDSIRQNLSLAQNDLQALPVQISKLAEQLQGAQPDDIVDMAQGRVKMPKWARALMYEQMDWMLKGGREQIDTVAANLYVASREALDKFSVSSLTQNFDSLPTEAQDALKDGDIHKFTARMLRDDVSKSMHRQFFEGGAKPMHTNPKLNTSAHFAIGGLYQDLFSFDGEVEPGRQSELLTWLLADSDPESELGKVINENTRFQPIRNMSVNEIQQTIDDFAQYDPNMQGFLTDKAEIIGDMTGNPEDYTDAIDGLKEIDDGKGNKIKANLNINGIDTNTDVPNYASTAEGTVAAFQREQERKVRKIGANHLPEAYDYLLKDYHQGSMAEATPETKRQVMNQARRMVLSGENGNEPLGLAIRELTDEEMIAGSKGASDRANLRLNQEINKALSATRRSVSISVNNIEEARFLHELNTGKVISNLSMMDAQGQSMLYYPGRNEDFVYSPAERQTRLLRDKRLNESTRSFIAGNGAMGFNREKVKRQGGIFSSISGQPLQSSDGHIPLLRNYGHDYNAVAKNTAMSPYDSRVNLNRVKAGQIGASVIDFETTGTAQMLDQWDGKYNQMLEVSARNVEWDGEGMTQPTKNSHLKMYIKPNENIESLVTGFDSERFQNEALKAINDVDQNAKANSRFALQQFLKNSEHVNVQMNIAKYSRLKGGAQQYADFDNMFKNIGLNQATVKALETGEGLHESIGEQEIRKLSTFMANVNRHARSGVKKLNQYGKDLPTALNILDEHVSLKSRTAKHKISRERAIVAQYGMGAELPWLLHNRKQAGLTGSGIAQNPWIELMHLSNEANSGARSHGLGAQVGRSGAALDAGTVADYQAGKHLAGIDTEAQRALFSHYAGTLDGQTNTDQLRKGDYLYRYNVSQGEKNTFNKGVYQINSYTQDTTENGNARYRLGLTALDGTETEMIGQSRYVDGKLQVSGRQSFERQYHSQFMPIPLGSDGKPSLENAQAFQRSLQFDDAREGISSAQSRYRDFVAERRKFEMASSRTTPGVVDDVDIDRLHSAHIDAIKKSEQGLVTAGPDPSQKYIGTQVSRLTEVEQQLISNQSTLDSQYGDRRTRNVSAREIEASKQMSGYFRSAEADLDQETLFNIHRLEQSGGITSDESSSMIRQWNAQKIEAAKAMAPGRANQTIRPAGLMALGDLGENFTGRANTAFNLRVGSVEQTVQSLWQTVNSQMKHMGKETKRADVINKMLLPRLKKESFINIPDDIASMENQVKIQTVAEQIEGHYRQNILPNGLGSEVRDVTQPLIQTKDEALYTRLAQESEQMTEAKYAQMGGVQRATYDKMGRLQQGMSDIVGADSFGGGHFEDLNLKATERGLHNYTGDLLQAPQEENLLFQHRNKPYTGDIVNGMGQINKMHPLSAIRQLKGLGNDNPTDIGIRDEGYRNLYKRATNYDGLTDYKVDSIIGRGRFLEDQGRIEAMEALEWLDVTRQDGQGNQVTSQQLRQMDTADALRTIQNARITSIEGRGVSERILTEGPEGIIGQKIRNIHPKDLTYIEQKNEIRGQNLNHVIQYSQGQMQNVTGDPLFGLDERGQIRGPQGDYDGGGALSASDPDVEFLGRRGTMQAGVEPGTVETGLSKAFDSLGKRVSNVADNVGRGKIAAIGAGGIAASMFAIAATNPMKITPESRSYNAEHEAYNESAQPREARTPSQPNQARLEDRQAGMRGMNVNVRANASHDINTNELGNKVGSSLGASGAQTNINIRSQDNRQGVDRDWLQERFTQMLNTGYINN